MTSRGNLPLQWKQIFNQGGPALQHSILFILPPFSPSSTLLQSFVVLLRGFQKETSCRNVMANCYLSSEMFDKDSDSITNTDRRGG
jgi:hypothetical protein